MDDLTLHGFHGDSLPRPSSPDNLHALLEDVENFIPGSNERTNSLEQLRSALVDRSSMLKPKGLGDHDMSRSGTRTRGGTGASSFLHGGVSPDDTHMLDDLYGESTGGMSSIPEHSGTDGLWGPAHTHFDASEYDDIEGTFQMDDIGDTLPPTMPTTYSHLHSRATTTISSAATKQATSASIQSHSAGTTAARIIGGPHVNRSIPGSQTSSAAAAIIQDVGFAAVAAGVPGAAGVLSGNLNIGKSAASAAVRSPVARPPSKTNVQMSNLAREEQAAIPHVSADDLGGAPVVPMQPEPDKRLSHKEVEQRRREKAKQYFDELRGLLPYGGDSAKFDKNAILHHSIALIKQLLSELEQEEASSAKTEQEPGTPTMAEFRCCFDVTRQPLCFTGLDSRIWEANTAFCTLLGYTRLEISGLSLLSATAPADTEASSERWHHMINSPQATPVSYMCKLQRKDSQQVSCNIDLSIVRRNGKAHCFLVAANPSL
mmetsp:Transcript_50004/g.156498  ORF Transcript_50004/g.156498 Transcript_50004/m.156498 type:complete len:487 (-) Transcript_50004:198-1658(-)